MNFFEGGYKRKWHINGFWVGIAGSLGGGWAAGPRVLKRSLEWVGLPGVSWMDATADPPQVMAERIIRMRRELYEALLANGCPGTWEHVINQIGMFTFTGVAPLRL